ncbi:MAG: DUF1801 domain-containing protein [Gammaproteobacteria bacterium]|nr:DUF1801 domain-containing protein [Gammaproteobacteria bacterium]
MSELKTKKNKASVREFIDSIEDSEKKKDCKQLATMMRKLSGKRAAMWGDSIVGFGEYHYKYKSGREGDWPVTGFSPRKQNISIYIMPGFSKYKKQLAKLGKHKHSVSCLYIKRLSDIDVEALKEIVADSIERMTRMYECK